MSARMLHDAAMTSRAVAFSVLSQLPSALHALPPPHIGMAAIPISGPGFRGCHRGLAASDDNL
jgi:hypothetical protein